MAIYELRTYTFQVGKLDQAKTLYVEKGWPALKKYQDTLFGDSDFMEFASQLRTLEVSQENRLLTSAPWGPAP